MTSGIAISQQGIDIKDAVDAQIILDSRWRYFDIYEEVEVRLGNISNSNSYVLYEHKLGFVPFFDCYNITNNTYMTEFNGQGGPSINTWSVVGGLMADANKIFYWGVHSGAQYANTTVLLRIYNVNSTQEYKAPVVSTQLKQISKPSKYGAKVSGLPNKNSMRDPEISHYTLNTQSKSLAIQQIGTAVSDINTGYLARVPHGLGVTPTFLVTFMAPDKSMIGAFNPQFVPISSYSNSREMNFGGMQSVLINRISYIIFKEFSDFVL